MNGADFLQPKDRSRTKSEIGIPWRVGPFYPHTSGIGMSDDIRARQHEDAE